jgi:tRNA (adenine57-N1/adenine58-N1)-methyltransferase
MTMTEDDRSRAQAGQLVLLYGGDRKPIIIRLTPGQQVQTHHGVLLHDDIIGESLGGMVRTHLGYRYYLLIPSQDDLLRNLRRATQIMYPKDIGYILVKMSIGPGRRVVEAGTGSGALAAALASGVAPTGRVTSYDVRADILTLARRNLETLGVADVVTLKERDIAGGFDERGVDALFLDVPAPWHYLDQAHAALRGSGFFGAILPTTNQVIELLRGLERAPFGFVEVEEVLLRGYKVVPARFRPDDRMVAHTGYLIFARALRAAEADEEE